MASLAFSLWIYFAYYAIQKKTDEKYPLQKTGLLPQAKLMRMVPSAGYSLLIIPMNLVYKKLAVLMTNFGKDQRCDEGDDAQRTCLENHRLQTSYENHLTSKLFLFYFVNCFIGLFYEAFFNANYGNVAQVTENHRYCQYKPVVLRHV